MSTKPAPGSRIGDDLVEAFAEMAAHIRGDVHAEGYEVGDDTLTPERIKQIRRRFASTTKAFEAEFHICARTMEAYEQGRRRPDDAMTALLRILDREPEAARRALAQSG